MSGEVHNNSKESAGYISKGKLNLVPDRIIIVSFTHLREIHGKYTSPPPLFSAFLCKILKENVFMREKYPSS